MRQLHQDLLGLIESARGDFPARLFKIGDNAEDNWLWRNMASWECGEKPAPGKTVGLSLI